MTFVAMDTLERRTDGAVAICRTAASARRALVVDGDPAFAQSLASMFADQGFVVETAPLGTEGVALAATRLYGLIVLGVDLPDMSGLEAMNRLRQADNGAAVIFASMTTAATAPFGAA
jgi:DNA-binding response OmpR family regulator